MLAWFLGQVFLGSVAHLRQACSGKGGFETPTSAAPELLPQRSTLHPVEGRFQTCPPLKQALNLPFLGGSCFPEYVTVLMKYLTKPEAECFLKRPVIQQAL